MKKKNILFIVIGILLLLSVINYWSGTTIVINGKHINSLGRYIVTYITLIFLAVALVILIPSVLILAIVLAIIFVVIALIFFPVMPGALILLSAIIPVGIIYLVYRLVRKKK